MTAEASSGRGRGRAEHPVAVLLLSTVVVLALVTAVSVVVLYRHLNANLTVEDVTGALGDDRPEKVRQAGPQEPINVLVMGSDSRSCEGCALDAEAGANASDTTILFHLSADRERAYAVSIPRDLIVDRPACGEDDQIAGGRDIIWNEAFTVGGQACTIRQFEAISDVFVDHYVVVNFAGFQDMVDAIGGVEVCIPEDIVDPAHGIDIQAGTRELAGEEALDYVRVRYDVGDQSDISRITRQQAFIASMVNKVVSAGTLTRVDRLVGFLNAATRSLTVDPGLEDVTKIGRLGLQFQGIGLDKISFVTVPNEYYPVDSPFSGRVRLLPAAEQLWAAIRDDQPLPASFTGDAITAADPQRGGGLKKPSKEEAAQAEEDGLCA